MTTQTTTREPLLVKVSEAARLLACDRATIYRRVQKGELTAVGREQAMRVTMAGIRAYVERNER